MRLLIVDDHSAMRRMMGKVVSDMVSEIEECSDGAEALAAYTRFHPDWVLMDIEMDHMDGLTATREIINVFPDAKVLIVSKYCDEPLLEAVYKAGASGHVIKENLLAIRKVLGTN